MDTLNFKVDGQWLTSFVRDRVIETNPTEAYNALRDSLIGMDEATAVSILKGDKALVGINDLDLVDEDPIIKKKYLQTLEYFFGDIVIIKGNYYRAYKAITSYGKEDNDEAKGCKEPYKSRARFYCENETDILVEHPCEYDGSIIDSYVALKKVDWFPFWMTPHKSIREAIEATKAIRGLYDGGWNETFGSFEKYSIPETPSVKDGYDSDEYYKDNKDQKFKNLRAKILDQSNETFEYDFGKKYGLLQIPKEPLIHWAMRRTSIDKSKLPKWDLICDSGEKMYNDDRYHTDWVVGAGVDVGEVYKNKDDDKQSFNFYQYLLLNEVQSWFLGDLNFNILHKSNTAGFCGVVVFPKKNEVCDSAMIAVIPNGRPEWFHSVKNAAGIIMENGGQLTHLVTVAGIEHNTDIIRLEQARKKLKKGSLISIDYEKNIIEVMA